LHQISNDEIPAFDRNWIYNSQRKFEEHLPDELRKFDADFYVKNKQEVKLLESLCLDPEKVTIYDVLSFKVAEIEDETPTEALRIEPLESILES